MTDTSTCVTDTSTLPCQGLGPEASLAYSCCSPGDAGQSGGSSSPPPLRHEKHVQKEMVSQLWLWVQMAWDGGQEWPAPPGRPRPAEGPHGEGSSGGGGAVPGLARSPSLQGTSAVGGWQAQDHGDGQLVGSPAPPRGMYIVFISVHRRPALPATGRAVFMAEARGRDSAAAAFCLTPGSRLAPWPLDIVLPLKSYLRTFGSLAIFTY